MNRLTAAAPALSLALSALAATPARAAEPAYAPGQDLCGHAPVLEFIRSRFIHKSIHYVGQDLFIRGFEHIQQTRYEPKTSDISSVERDYCKAHVALNDGTVRPMWYLIERPWGFAGLGRSVEFCVADLDPWHVYGTDCKSLR